MEKRTPPIQSRPLRALFHGMPRGCFGGTKKVSISRRYNIKHRKLTVEDEHANASNSLHDKARPVQPSPSVVIVEDGVASRNRAHNDEDIDNTIGKNDTNMAPLVWHQLGDGNQSNTRNTTSASVQTQSGDEHDIGLGCGTEDIAHGSNYARQEKEGASAEEI